MLTVNELYAALGRDRIRKECGLSPQVLTDARRRNVLPTRWSFEFRRMCEADGIEFPAHLFRHMQSPAAAVAAFRTAISVALDHVDRLDLDDTREAAALARRLDQAVDARQLVLRTAAAAAE